MQSTTYCGLRALIFITALALAVSEPALAWPLTYSAPEIHARVVDQETGKPIDGAIVLARWTLLTELMGGNSHYFTQEHEFETTTDRDGWFTIPPWGPKPHAPNTHLTFEVPGFWVFKPGYFAGRFVNKGNVRSDAWVVESDWDGKEMPLRRFDGKDWKDYLRSIYGVSGIWSYSALDDCLRARSCPRMVLAIYAEFDRTSNSVPTEVLRREAHPPPIRTLLPEEREFLKKVRAQHNP